MTETAEKKTILILGGYGTIGGEGALEMAKRGAHVVLLGRSADKLKLEEKRIRDLVSESDANDITPEISSVTIDLSDTESIRVSAKKCLDQFPKIDGMVVSTFGYKTGGPHVMSDGHEHMFATNIIGPFLFINLVLERMIESKTLILHVIAPLNKAINWDDLESIKSYSLMSAITRTKSLHKMIAGELARRYDGKISSMGYDPTDILPRPGRKPNYPPGLMGFVIKVMFAIVGKPATVAAVPMAKIMLETKDKASLNGTIYRLEKKSGKPDKAMHDPESGKRLWTELEKITGLSLV